MAELHSSESIHPDDSDFHHNEMLRMGDQSHNLHPDDTLEHHQLGNAGIDLTLGRTGHACVDFYHHTQLAHADKSRQCNALGHKRSLRKESAHHTGYTHHAQSSCNDTHRNNMWPTYKAPHPQRRRNLYR
jgi:hypothetical protein